MRRKRVLAVAVATVAMGLVVGSVEAGNIGPNPANHESLINKPLESPNYDRAGKRCAKSVPKGTIALKRWLRRHTRGNYIGSIRCERGSLHNNGRAIDWAMDARHKSQKRQAMKLIRKRLLTRDRKGRKNALAHRMGVQGIIFNCRSWWSSNRGLDTYGYCEGKRRNQLDPTAAHIDHIHIELNRPGARKKTSFWQSPVSRR